MGFKKKFIIMKSKKITLGLAIGLNIAAAIYSIFSKQNTLFVTHLTLVVVLLTLIEKEEN